ncbi:Hypothetical predicted protein [Podarcis lilfordi]|uniref:Uncharacterized protein n=1 Tax=Podarcis lilfordi TaxID=74358 RepID=A0AA35KEY9_9SAUR|nr:Hypothetical predicted protein [Podarcis lilfordi]
MHRVFLFRSPGGLRQEPFLLFRLLQKRGFPVNDSRVRQIFETEKCFKFWLGFHSYIEILLMATNSRRASMLFCCNTNGQQSPSVFHT